MKDFKKEISFYLFQFFAMNYFIPEECGWILSGLNHEPKNRKL